MKNAVIVPVGAKGGFIVKRLPDDGGREAMQAEGIAATRPSSRAARPHRQSVADGSVVPPPQVRAPRRRRSLSRGRRRQGHGDVLRYRQRHSPRARLLAGRRLRLRRQPRLRPQEDGHHRARRLGSGEAPFPRDGPRHPEPSAFTCIGVGDMSGDVFGNGMLLSKHTKLVAAFDHRAYLHRSRS